MALKISPAKKQKLKSAFNPDLHPRYPKGHPQGGKFMPKGSADYNQAIAANPKPEWELVSSKDFRKHFKQWDKWNQEVYNAAVEHDFPTKQAKEIDREITSTVLEIAELQSTLKASTTVPEYRIKMTQFLIDSYERRIKETTQALANIGDQSSPEAQKLKERKADIKAQLEEQREIMSKVSPTNSKNLSAAKKIADLQAEVAEKRKKLEDIRSKHPKKTKVPVERLTDSVVLYETFAENMRGKTLVGVKDKKGDEMEAAAAISSYKNYIYIDYLMTNPRSLIEGKSKGAGTAAIKAVVKKSMDMGKGGEVRLHALKSAEPFYEKIGFTREDPRGNYFILTSEAAKKLLGD